MALPKEAPNSAFASTGTSHLGLTPPCPSLLAAFGDAAVVPRYQLNQIAHRRLRGAAPGSPDTQTSCWERAGEVTKGTGLDSAEIIR